jgi:hypothetical protein
MSAVSELIVREYLESLGFLVRMPRKYMVIARARRPDEEVDLLAWRPDGGGPPPEPGVWTGEQLRKVRSAMIAVRGWHTETFSPAVMEMSPELFRFAEPDSARAAGDRMGGEPLTRILCLPSLPSAEDSRAAALRLLARRGVDGVLTFRTILLEMIAMVETPRHYERSDLLQILRILKTYDLLQSPQMDLFRGGRASPASRRGRRRGAADAPPAVTTEAAPPPAGNETA